jgi:chemotaxis signal transduction protein
VTVAENAAHEVDLVVFEAGGLRWAADAFDVRRIDRLVADLKVASLAESPSADRALVVGQGSREVQVPIERLVGFERVGPAQLRRLPAFVETLGSSVVAGAWLAPEAIVLLIDLLALVNEKQGAAPAVAPPAP